MKRSALRSFEYYPSDEGDEGDVLMRKNVVATSVLSGIREVSAQEIAETVAGVPGRKPVGFFRATSSTVAERCEALFSSRKHKLAECCGEDRELESLADELLGIEIS